MEYTAGRGTTALGIVGTVLGGTALAGGNGLLGNILGGNAGECNMPVSRYDMGLIRDNMSKDAEISLLKADAYSNQKFAELNDRYNARFTNLEAQIAAQAVHNAKTEGGFALVHADIKAVHDELKNDIAMEAERRSCADNLLADYVNSTFYPKLVADVTAGSTTTAQATYNPVRNCCCNK